MVKIDIISGFLGAGKTTLIQKLIGTTFPRERLVVIENEFGEIGIDGVILRDTGVQIREINSGCICCTLTGDFEQALLEMAKTYRPDRIIVEPSGVGKLSDVVKACERVVARGGYQWNVLATVVDAMRFQAYLRNFAEFYRDQIANAHTVVLSKTQGLPQDKLEMVAAGVRAINATANIVTTPWDELDAERMLAVLQGNTAALLLETKTEEPAPGHGDHHNHGHAGHEHDHHGHDADGFFDVWSAETARTFDKAELASILKNLDGATDLGMALRAKGILSSGGGRWIRFDYVPGRYDIVPAEPEYTGRLCVIGHELATDRLKAVFGLKKR